MSGRLFAIAQALRGPETYEAARRIRAARAENPPTPREQFEAGRDWLADCAWCDLTEPEDFDDLTGREIQRAVERHYVGGWAQFLADGAAR